MPGSERVEMKMAACAMFFVVISLVGCSDTPQYVGGIDSVGADKRLIVKDGEKEVTYRIVIIDGCEYILGSDNGVNNGGYFLTHKGNCRNKLHHQPSAGSP